MYEAVSASSSRRISCCLYASATAPAGVNPDRACEPLDDNDELFARGEVAGREAEAVDDVRGRVCSENTVSSWTTIG